MWINKKLKQKKRILECNFFLLLWKVILIIQLFFCLCRFFFVFIYTQANYFPNLGKNCWFSVIQQLLLWTHYQATHSFVLFCFKFFIYSSLIWVRFIFNQQKWNSTYVSNSMGWLGWRLAKIWCCISDE